MRRKGKGGKHQVPPAAKTAAQPNKVPRVGEPFDFWGAHPTWSFAILDLVWPEGGWTRICQDDLDDLLNCFRRWEGLTWKQILAEDRKRNHNVYVSKCIPAAQTRLKILKLDDLEELVSLSVTARIRVYGILDRATFRLLWWDPEHKICPSHAKD